MIIAESTPPLLKKRGGGGEDNAPFLERSARLDISERTSNPLLPRKVRSPLCERIEQATDRLTVASIPSIRQGQLYLLETLKASVLFGFQFWSVEDQISLKICGFPQSTPQLQLVHLPPLPPSRLACTKELYEGRMLNDRESLELLQTSSLTGTTYEE